jgi:DNA-binding CsgD family transcriptional regulator
VRRSEPEASTRYGEGLALTITEFLSGTLYLGLGRYDAALAAAGGAECYYEEGPAIWALSELIEAAAGSGQPHLAGGALARIVETTGAAATDWALGIEAFAGRAERELLATGEGVRKHAVDTRDELTAQEAQVARLARDGLSNAEIGERLFISQHTAAYHLRKVFSKLGVTSRNELGRVLPESAGVGQVA